MPRKSAPNAPRDDERLAKRVAEIVPCSRREAEQYIEGGWVSVDGQIVEEGSHAELLARNGLYARYWNRQSGGFIGTEEKEAAE